MVTLTIFWTALHRSDVASLEDAVRDHDATLVQVSIDMLPVRVIPALASGMVLAVCLSNSEASLALSAGVDEVLRSGEVTPEALREAIERANARATARSSRGLRRMLLEDDDDVVLTLLGTALRDDLKVPLSSAENELDRLYQSIPALLEAGDDFVAWTSSTNRDTPRRIAARRLAGPSSDELKGGLSRLHDAIRRARRIVEGMLRLSRDNELPVSASYVITDVVEVLNGAQTYAELSVETEGACLCTVSRNALVLTVTALAAHALESVRAANRQPGKIAVRVFSAEEAVIIEVQDDGQEVPADLRPDALEPYFRDPTSHRPGLPGVRDRVRRMGGDLVVDSGPQGNLVRVMLPVSTGTSAYVERAPEKTASFRKAFD